MSAPSTQPPRPKPSTPASSSAQPSQLVTPRSNIASSYASPAKSHSRGPSGSQLMPGRTVGSHPMQRTTSSGLGSSLGTSGSATPTRSVNGTSSRGVAAGKKSAGKTVLGMSSVAKNLGVDNLGSRPVTPGGTNVSSLDDGSPAVVKGSPAPSSMGGGMAHLDALAGLVSPALSGLPAVPGSADMGLSLSNISGLGLGGTLTESMQGGKLDDETRRKRLEIVLQTLRKRSGSISREGIQRLARKCGMETYWDGDDNVTLAGQNSVMIDLHYKPEKSHSVERTKMQLHAVSDELEAHSEKASKILQDDLTPGNGLSAIEAKLDKFANNLERLVAMDKLSTPGANCFEAVFGVYKSLKRLYNHELKALQSLRSQEDKSSKVSPAIEVLCAKSGRPKMHAQDRVGLSLEYWVNRSGVPRSAPSKPDDAMDVDKATDAEATSKDDYIYSTTIECEHAPSALYPPIRISDGWISDQILIPSEEHVADEPTTAPNPQSLLIDWQQPPPTYQTPANESDTTTSTPLLPHARFVAHFEPPLALPIHLAANVYASVGLNLQSTGFVASPYDKLLLTDLAKGDRMILRAAPPSADYPYTRTAIRSILLPTTKSNPDSNEQTIRYTTRIFTPRAEHSFTLQRVPFEHPRQIVAILPVLRQFARFNTIVRQSYQSATPPPLINTTASPSKPNPTRRIARKRPFETAFPFSTTTNPTADANADPADDEVDAFLRAPPEVNVPQTIEMTYSVLPSPTVEVTFPTAKALKFVRFGIGLDGFIAVEAQDLFDEVGGREDDQDRLEGEREEGEGEREGESEGKEYRKNEEVRAKIDKMARALEVCEDLSFWVVWCRRVLLGEELEVEREDGGEGDARADT